MEFKLNTAGSRNFGSIKSFQLGFSSKGRIEERIERITGIDKDCFQINNNGIFHSPRIVRPGHIKGIFNTNGNLNRRKYTEVQKQDTDSRGRITDGILLDNFRIKPMKMRMTPKKSSKTKVNMKKLLMLILKGNERVKFRESTICCSDNEKSICKLY